MASNKATMSVNGRHFLKWREKPVGNQTSNAAENTVGSVPSSTTERRLFKWRGSKVEGQTSGASSFNGGRRLVKWCDNGVENSTSGTAVNAVARGSSSTTTDVRATSDEASSSLTLVHRTNPVSEKEAVDKAPQSQESVPNDTAIVKPPHIQTEEGTTPIKMPKIVELRTVPHSNNVRVFLVHRDRLIDGLDEYMVKSDTSSPVKDLKVTIVQRDRGEKGPRGYQNDALGRRRSREPRRIRDRRGTPRL